MPSAGAGNTGAGAGLQAPFGGRMSQKPVQRAGGDGALQAG